MNLRALDYGRGGLERAFSLRLINTIEEVAGAEKDRPSGFKAMEESHGLGVARDRARTRDMSDRINVYSDRNARTPTLLRKTVHVHPSHAWTHVARDSSSRLALQAETRKHKVSEGIVAEERCNAAHLHLRYGWPWPSHSGPRPVVGRDRKGLQSAGEAQAPTEVVQRRMRRQDRTARLTLK